MRLVLLALTFAFASCSSSDYDRNDLELVTAFTAKHLCSCLFVMERDEEYCRAWSEQSPAVATSSIDWREKSVQSEALLMWSATARFAGDRYGCVLD